MKGMITGTAGSRSVEFDGEYLDPRPSQKVWNHSPDGFAWGYGGSGPAQLALAIMLKVTTREQAIQLYQRFKASFIAALPIDQDFSMSIENVQEWVADEIAAAEKRAQQ
jgi:hypothetical protein